MSMLVAVLALLTLAVLGALFGGTRSGTEHSTQAVLVAVAGIAWAACVWCGLALLAREAEQDRAWQARIRSQAGSRRMNLVQAMAPPVRWVGIRWTAGQSTRWRCPRVDASQQSIPRMVEFFDGGSSEPMGGNQTVPHDRPFLVQPAFCAASLAGMTLFSAAVAAVFVYGGSPVRRVHVDTRQ